MRKLAIFLLAINLLHLWLTLGIGGLQEWYSLKVYHFVVPHVWALVAALTLLVVVVIGPQWSVAVTLTMCALFVTLATAIFAMSHWPSGDHGAGTAWLVFVGGLSVVNVLGALALMVLAATKRPDRSGVRSARSARR